jgi:predicted DNA-binding transcriptional regulator AlpA
MGRLLNINTASEYAGISPNMIRDLIGKRQFPYKNISRGAKPVFRFDVKELDKWIDQLPGASVEELIA